MVSRRKIKERSPQIAISIISVLICIGLLTYMWRDGQFDNPQTKVEKTRESPANIDDAIDLLLSKYSKNSSIKETFYKDGEINITELELAVRLHVGMVEVNYMEEHSCYPDPKIINPN